MYSFLISICCRIVLGFGERADALCVKKADGPTQDDVGQVATVEQLVDLVHIDEGVELPLRDSRGEM